MDQKLKKVTIVHVGDFILHPPVINLVENMLKNGLEIKLVSSTEENRVPEKLKRHNFQYYHVPFTTESGLVPKVKRAIFYKKAFRKTVEQSMQTSDVLWTTTDLTVKILGDMLLQYKHIMQLMELIQRYPRFLGIDYWDFPIDKYARAAYKVVVPDLDRAYIQQVWWNLPNVPIVLPNKPYTIDTGTLTDNTQLTLEKMKKEKRKIVLYTGIISPERNIVDFAEALREREDYCLYMIGKSNQSEEVFEKFLNDYPNVVYLGYHDAPAHLAFLQYAYIGLTPYNPTTANSNLYPKINALYCAPNKVYEYTAFGVPMIGTNVLGLLRPFEQYGIGRSSKNMSPESILNCIEYIEDHYEEMSENCYKFFKKDDLDQIVKDILN